MSLSLNPTIQSLSLNKYDMLKDLACIGIEKTVTQLYLEKTFKWTNKGKNKSTESDSQSHEFNN